MCACLQPSRPWRDKSHRLDHNARLSRRAATRRLARARSGITISDAAARTIPTMLVSGCSWRRSDVAASTETYNASTKKLMPTSLCASRSRRLSVSAPRKRHSKILPDKLSMRESIPNPISAMLPANTPAPHRHSRLGQVPAECEVFQLSARAKLFAVEGLRQSHFFSNLAIPAFAKSGTESDKSAVQKWPT